MSFRTEIGWLGAIFVLLGMGPAARCAPAPLTLEEQTKINQAIAQGMSYLSESQGPTGTWALKDGSHPTGWAALPALTLLQCGVPADNPVIQRAARYVRDSYPTVENTYEVALALLFLDQYDQSNVHVGGSLAETRLDAKLIEVLAVRLMAAQSITGGWNYTSKPLANNYHRWMLRALKEHPLRRASLPGSLKRLPVFQDPAKLMVTDEDTDTEKADPKQEPVKKKPLKKRSRRGDAPGTPVVDTTSDNSVTHFALLALWTAKHRGVPVDRSLRLLTKRFRTSQSADGSWNYKYQKGGGLPESAPMICAGLLGLALEFGLSDSAESKHALPAPAGAAHLSFAMMGAPSPASFAAAVYTTGQSLAANRAATRRATDRAIVRGIDALTRHVGLPAGRMDNVPQGSLYFLWALERVAVLYDLKTIGGKDWYRWGAEQLVANQKQNGNWDSAYPGTIDTCFALLFLKQANLTSDLTSKLQKDPKAQAKLVKSTAPEPAAPVSPPSALVPVLKPVETPPVQPSPPPNTEAGPPKKDSSKPKAAEPPATKDEESTKSNTWLVAAVGGLAVVLLGCSAVLVLMSRGKAGRAEAGEKRSKRARTERANGKAASSAKTAVKKKGAPNSSAGDEEPDRARAVARKKGKPPMY